MGTGQTRIDSPLVISYCYSDICSISSGGEG
jgi:hypothetical protein